MLNAPARGLFSAVAAGLFALAGCGGSSGSSASDAGGGGAEAQVESGGSHGEDGSSATPPDGDAGGASLGDDAQAQPDAGASSIGDGSLPADAVLLGDSGGGRAYVVSNQCAQTVWAAALPASTFPGGLVE